MSKPITTLQDARNFVAGLTQPFELYAIDRFWVINAYGHLWKSVGCEDGRLIYAIHKATAFDTALWCFLHRRAVNFVLRGQQ